MGSPPRHCAAEWPHGIECQCEQCETQMEQRGVMCVVCIERYYDWSLRIHCIEEYIEELGLGL